MNKILISIILVFSFLNAKNESSWTYSHRYSLEKDEIANIGYSTTASKGEDKSKLFFRWTSIVGDRVTVLVNHKGYPHQYVLYKKRSLDSIKLYFLPNGSNQIEERSYLLLSLSDINQDNGEVNFDIFVKDNKNRILVKF